jgi:hypothetical protein
MNEGKGQARNLFSGIVGRLWYIAETLVSYAAALIESFVFIAFSGIFIALRTLLSKETDEELTATENNSRKQSSTCKIIHIYYGSQTGTAKVTLIIIIKSASSFYENEMFLCPSECEI